MIFEILTFFSVTTFSYILITTFGIDNTSEYPYPFPEESIPRFQR